LSDDALYQAALCAAFWVAVCGARAGFGSAGEGARFVAGLAFGALLARAGGLLLVPAGLLLAAPLGARERASFLDAALPTLPLAFAAAKLGCIAAGCCAAAGGEALGFAAVHAAVRFGPERHATALALAGIGAVRLVALPLRPEARGSVLLAAGCLLLAALRCRPSCGESRCPPPGSAISRPTAGSSKPGYAASSRAHAISR
jgi:hypothetical protein